MKIYQNLHLILHTTRSNFFFSIKAKNCHMLVVGLGIIKIAMKRKKDEKSGSE